MAEETLTPPAECPELEDLGGAQPLTLSDDPEMLVRISRALYTLAGRETSPHRCARLLLMSGWLRGFKARSFGEVPDTDRHDALGDAIAYYESKNGKITEEDLAAVRVKWPRKG